MQLIVAAELLAAIRAKEGAKAFGRLHCDLISPDVLLARNLPGNNPVSYEDFAIDTSSPNGTMRLPWLLTEPPLEDHPVPLEPRLPLGARRLATVGVQPEQPFLKTLFDDPGHLLLVVGTDSVRLLKRRSTAWKSGPLWYPASVAVIPVRPGNVGLDPNLKGRSVAIVGVGSIGSRVAQLLVAGGVKKLVLADPDALDFRNLRRHVCGVKYIGQPKVDALQSWFVDAGFDIEVKSLAVSVPREDSYSVRETLAACEVLVSCAASGPAQHYVNHLARHLGLPSVIASVKLMPQALGEVALCLPNVPGCLNCWRLELEATGLMMREDTHDPVDYPGPTAETPQGLPAYLLDQIASTACNLVSRTVIEKEPRVWLQAMERSVENFDDLGVQEARFDLIAPQSNCLVCSGDD
ncbi:MAG TPA: ThiF family adenylyltransferase [Solirubrobacterales bacterium]|jgi:hypothetical protein